MNILQLELKNFRSFEGEEKEVNIFLNKGINVIIGENNVGKSSLLRALQIVARQITPVQSDYYKGAVHKELLLDVKIELKTNELYALLRNMTGNSSFLQEQENVRRIARDVGNQFTLSYSSKHGFFLKTDDLQFNNDSLTMSSKNKLKASFRWKIEQFLGRYFSTEKHHSIVSIMKERREATSAEPNLILAGDVRGYVQNLLKTQLKVFSEIRKRPAGAIHRIFESLDGGEVAAVLFSLKNGNKREQKKYDTIKQEFSKLFKNLDLDARLGPNNTPQIFIDKKSIDYDMPLENVGAGIGDMVILLTHLIESEDLIFGLDLPEMQFHPHAQRLLLKVLLEHAQNNQIFIVTHSPMLLNPKNLKKLVIIRERNGKSFPSQLSRNYFNKQENTKLERLLLTVNKDFFFSRATLVVEGPTELGALPVFSESLDIDFDTNGISLVKMQGNHFGLLEKLLSGFDIPHTIMCDNDALMFIDGSINCGRLKAKTSPVFCSLSKANHLTQEDRKRILELQNEIVKIDGTETYPDSSFEELKAIAKKNNVFPLSSDFEGVLKKEGFDDLLKGAASLSKSKPIQGRIVAEKIIENEQLIPSEFTAVIYAIFDIANKL